MTGIIPKIFIDHRCGKSMSIDFSIAKNTFIGSNLFKNNMTYEPEVTDLLFRLIKKGEGDFLFLNIGSNIGYYPLILSEFTRNLNKNLTIYAHEPLPEIVSMAKALQSVNSIEYNLSTAAISDYTGMADFYVSANGDSSNSLVKGFRKVKQVIPVEVSTLDYLYYDLIDKNNFNNIIILIDVETNEPAVIRGAKNIITKFRPVIICEVLKNMTEKDLQSVFDELDYLPYCFNGSQWEYRKIIRGDETYSYMDQCFIPSEKKELEDIICGLPVCAGLQGGSPAR